MPTAATETRDQKATLPLLSYARKSQPQNGRHPSASSAFANSRANSDNHNVNDSRVNSNGRVDSLASPRSFTGRNSSSAYETDDDLAAPNRSKLQVPNPAANVMLGSKSLNLSTSRESLSSDVSRCRSATDQWKLALTNVLSAHWLQFQKQRILSFLLLVCIYTLVFIVVMFAEGKMHSDTVTAILFLSLICHSVVFLSLFFLLPMTASVSKSRLRLLLQTVSMLTTFVLPVTIWLCISFWFSAAVDQRNILENHVGLPAIMNIVLANYVLLMLPNFSSIIISMLMSGIHLILISVMAFSPHRSIDFASVAANALVLLCSNMIGFYHSLNLVSHRKHLTRDFEEVVEKRTVVQFEKERQEQLLLSIIPIYLAEKVKKLIMDKASTYRNVSAEVEPPKLFHDFHVTTHDNVSILFADIVNFTPLTAELTVPQLVKTLNELYSRFDELAQEFQCMRIKILGDCYYCVSGMPVSRPQHADNCVKMGLGMIDAIKTVREAVNVNIDMRIGVHSGHVLAGILGLKKWQFDIWSDDVTLANQMESSGKPGLVHITSSTMQLLAGSYEVEAADRSQVNAFVANSGLETYFIRPTPVSAAESTAIKSPKPVRSSSTHFFANSMPRASLPKSMSSIADQMDDIDVVTSANNSSRDSARASQQATKPSKMAEFWGAQTPFAHFGRKQSSDEIRIASIGAVEGEYERIREPKDRSAIMNDFLLYFRDKALEKIYAKMIRPAYRVQLLMLPVIFLAVATVEILVISRSLISVLIMSSIETLLILYSLTFWLRQWKSLKKSNQFAGRFQTTKFSQLPLPESICLTLLLCLLLGATISLLPLCDYATFSANGVVSDRIQCISPAHFLACCQLALMIISTVYSLGFASRLCLLLLCTVAYLAIFLLSYPSGVIISSDLQLMLPENNGTNFTDLGAEVPQLILPLDFKIRACIHLSALFLLLLLIDWQLEFEKRVDCACLASFRGEQDDVETMQDINTLLLRNILPEHVATHFLDISSSSGFAEELYHEYHENVCVMFASIPNFQDFWGSWDISRKLECLRLLNEIFCEFDKLLSKPKFSNVEKIKTVGSTYMAAAGLQPAPAGHKRDTRRFAAIMLEFAFQMMHLLEQLNRDAFQTFKLRIGMCYGPAIAGVIGAQKPQYDIWGNTVNLASRMDSHGSMGSIHVTSETAEALISCGYEVISRGKQKIKGVKEPMETFFVKQNH